MKVLVIEDSKSFSAIIEAQIDSDYGYPCIKAASLAMAKEVIEKQGSDFFAAVIDLNLPDASNGEAVDYCLSLGIPSIVFTGQINQTMRDTFIRKGVADYVLKDGAYNLKYMSLAIHRLHSNKSKQVLIVDESAQSLDTMTKLLKVQQYQSFTAQSDKQALDALEKNTEISIIIIDYSTPGVNGHELTSAIRMKYPDRLLKIIGISGVDDSNIAIRFIKSGANDFLQKPFEPEEIYCRLNNITDHIDQIVQQNRLNEEKNKFLGMAAHDIRTPLGIIKKAAERLLNTELKESRRLDMLNMISNNSGNMINLLTDLLDIATIESGRIDLKYQEVNLSDLIEERFNLHQHTAKEKNIKINAQIEPSLSSQIDPERFVQVIDNLITNAIKYSPLDSTVGITLEKKDTQWALTISDNGPGIKPDEVSKLFGAFEKLSSKTTAGETSNGLGLAIVKRIVEAHNGEAHYENNEPCGSKFSVVIPFVNNAI